VNRAVSLPPFGTFGNAGKLVELAKLAEDSGWDGFFLWDHVLYESHVPLCDTRSMLAAAAVSPARIRIGPLVTPLPRRRTWMVARQSVAVDHLSGGRLIMGVGLGIDFWREFSAFGEVATNDRTRAAIVDEGLDVLVGLWAGEPVEHHGERIVVEGARFLPSPIQVPRIPIWTAALWPIRPGPLRRAGRWDGIAPFSPAGLLTPADAEQLRRDVAHARGNDTFDLCVAGQQSRARDYEAAGVTWLVESFLPDEPMDEVRRSIASGPREG
jgi:alkanesulfonate monooxygenase SsuD/methylene tetrahydromethanopterin reductase-like flavin-dependent oxidoreductase (luciferase family)